MHEAFSDVLIPHAIIPTLPPRGSVTHDVRGTSMGCTWSARVLAPPGAQLTLGTQLQRQLDELVDQMSHWESGSALSRFNAAPAGSWHVLPEAFFTVLAYALEVAQDSGGAYDPCAGALVNAWGFGASGRHHQAGFVAPAPARIDALLAARQPILLDHARRAAFQPGGVQLDLSSSAKGYAVDRMAQLLAAQGLQHYLVELGGELRGAGMKPDGQPWWVEIENLPGDDGLPTRVALHGLALASSGSYRQSFQDGLQTRAHTLDPRSGRPLENGVLAASVLHAECMVADAWSTAIGVLGPQEGISLADQRGLAARLLVRADGKTAAITSAAWRAMLA